MNNHSALSIDTQKIKSPTQVTTVSSQDLKKKFFPKGISLVANSINALYKIAPMAAARSTMFLLSLSIYKKVKKADHLFYSQGKKQTFRYKNKTFNTFSYGSGPKILLVHGWASNGARWKKKVKRLVENGYTAVVMDAPGQGTSKGMWLSVPDYIQCVRTVLESQDNWYGLITHSVGSLAGIIGASEAGQLKKLKIAMMCTFSDCDALMTKYARCMGINERTLSFTKQNIDKIYGQPLPHFSLIRHYRNLNAESILIYNQKDIIVPDSEAHLISAALPDVELFATDEGGHNLRCQEVEDLVIDFIT